MRSKIPPSTKPMIRKFLAFLGSLSLLISHAKIAPKGIKPIQTRESKYHQFETF